MTSAIITTIEADLSAAWGDLEAVVDADATAAWASIKTTFTALLPSQWTLLQGWVSTAMGDVASGDYAALETAVLNLAGEEATWLTTLGSALIQAVIAVIVASLKTPA